MQIRNPGKKSETTSWCERCLRVSGFSPRGAAFHHPGGEVSHWTAVNQADSSAEEAGQTVPQAAEEL